MALLYQDDVAEADDEAEPKPKKAGMFAKLFAKKAPAGDETDEKGEGEEGENDAVKEEEEEEGSPGSPTKKKGFMQRLFRKKSIDATGDVPEEGAVAATAAAAGEVEEEVGADEGMIEDTSNQTKKAKVLKPVKIVGKFRKEVELATVYTDQTFLRQARLEVRHLLTSSCTYPRTHKHTSLFKLFNTHTHSICH